MNPEAATFILPDFKSEDGNPSPEHFLLFLREIINEHLGPVNSVNKYTKDTWVTIMVSLTDYLLSSFPSPDIVTWDTMTEKIDLVEATLEVIFRVFTRVNGIYNDSEDFINKIFAKLLKLCFILELWLEQDFEPTGTITTPSSMRNKVLQTLTQVLRGLGTVFSPSDNIQNSWRMLRHIIFEVVEVHRTLIGPPCPSSYPVAVKLFNQPRVRQVQGDTFQNEDGVDFSIIIQTSGQAPVFLATTLEILFPVFSQEQASHLFMADTLRSILELSKSLFDHCLNPVCSISGSRRSKIFAKLLSPGSLTLLNESETVLSYMRQRFVQIRLNGGLDHEGQAADSVVRKWLDKHSITPLKSSVSQALTILKAENGVTQDVDLSVLACSYIRSCLDEADEGLLQIMKINLDNCEIPQKAFLLAEIEGLWKRLPSELVPLEVTGKLDLEEHVWRRQVHDLVQEIVKPDSISWMEDDSDPQEPQVIRRVLNDVCDRFTRPLWLTSEDSRIATANALEKLPCLMTLCSGVDCITFRKQHDIITTNFYLPAVDRLLDGTEGEVTPAVRRAVYAAFCSILKHRSDENPGEHCLNTIFSGVADKDRSTRLRAGSALNAIIQVYATTHEDIRAQTEVFFDRIYRQIETAKNPIRETLLVSVGLMGKTQNVVILGQVLCLLVAQLARENPIIRALANMQIISTAKYHKKTPYSLILPYMDQVAPFIIHRLSTQPSLLTEACRLMLIAPADFISITISRTLPDLFARCDMKALEIVAKELGTTQSSLVVKHMHTNLARIFLLPTSGQTNKALKFVLGILSEATRGTIDIQNIVKSCTIPLLAELVIVMGEETEDAVDMALSALRKVETAIVTGKSRMTQDADPSSFLKLYMLGIISGINDMLQDVQGKKSVTEKRKILRSLGALVLQIGPAISSVSPQIMATFQTMICIPELSEITLDSWHKFLVTLGPAEVGPHIGPACAAFITSWPTLSPRARQTAYESLEYIFTRFGRDLGRYVDEIVDLSTIDDLKPLEDYLNMLRGPLSPKDDLQRILERASSNNLTVASLSLAELKQFMQLEQKDFIRNLASGDVFDPLVSQILSTLFAAACRDGDGTDNLKLLAFECIGVLGAIDPYRFEVGVKDASMVVRKNFTDESESVAFVLHLIQDLLVGAFRSTSDIKYQSHLAYTIQELLRYCGFSPALVTPGQTTGVTVKVRNRWNALPKHVLETVTPLLEARFTLNQSSIPDNQSPIYPTQSTYREWIQLWTTQLILKASGGVAQRIFGVFRSAVRNKDVVVAHHLLPHLVLNILISGNDDDAQDIRNEMLAVLADQVDNESSSPSDKKLLSAQAVFVLLDHLNKWARIVRQEINTKKAESKRARPNQINNHVEEQLLRLDSILSSIDQNLMAKAAFQCKAFARSLMSFEQQIIILRERSESSRNLPDYYEKLHEIYAHLDEPDGMEGISTLLLSPSLEHQIREHESTGRWTAAQSCWEVRLQQSPNNVDFHLGLLRCLRNLGHYDTLRTHVRGVLTRHPEWELALADFQVESAWMVGAWDDVRDLAQKINAQTPSIVIARVLLAMRDCNADSVCDALTIARKTLGAPITAAGVKSYRRSYDAVLDLHLTHELELIHNVTSNLPSASLKRQETLLDLTQTLSARLQSTLPTFRSREPILSMRRTGFSLVPTRRCNLVGEIGRSWLASSKIARKAGQWQTAYSAMLQARQNDAKFYFMESAKLVKATGEPLRALQELENPLKLLWLNDDPDVLDLTVDEETKKMKAKVHVLRARWMNESDRFDVNSILDVFKEAIDLQKKWESAHFYNGNFYDKSFKALQLSEQAKRGVKMNMYTVRSYAKAIRYGSKYVYQTVPRLLTIWLDMGEDKALGGSDFFNKINEIVANAIKDAPAYKWYTAFPQIVSRVGHSVDKVYKLLSQLIVAVMQEYPKQTLWQFTSVVKSTKSTREQRGRAILEQLRSSPSSNRQLPKLVADSIAMTNELLALCDRHIDDDKKSLLMSKDFPKLKALGRCDLLVPLQESLTATLPSTTSTTSRHQPFPSNAPTFQEFADEVEIMRSMAKPRKITILGSNGQVYMFLGKPKDDLRKDARLMDFNAIINKLLKANSDSRRRQLHIRTYGIVTLNEECGFIQWVPNTIPIRPVLIKAYEARRVKSWSGEMSDIFKHIKEAKDEPQAGTLFVEKILPMFPPVFHEWFIETFPEPTAWLAGRLTYGRTAAVMSMVGWILGLGDRHCENILLDTNTGDVVHVDFNCLFDKGKSLETPERVPFRLTQNIVDGLGITGIEGVFRIACELTLQLLRDNKDSLMSVLDAFIHDPLVEWEDEKRKMERQPSRTKAKVNVNQLPSHINLDTLARSSLNPIEKKLKGIYTSTKDKHEKVERKLSTSNLVQMLIQEATDDVNLAKMYPGWAPWY